MEEEKYSESSPIMGEMATKSKLASSSYTKEALFDVGRARKMVVVVSTFGVALLVLYYASRTNFGELLPSLNVKNKNYYSYELRKVLEAASTEEKTVILTTLNEAWAAPSSVFDIFLESFRNGNDTCRLLNHLVVIAVDNQAYIRCRQLVRHCYFLKSKKSSKMAHEAKFMSPLYVEMMWARLAFLHDILSMGYNFVFTDTDVMWFRDPFPHFTPDADFQTSCDNFNGLEFDIRNSPNNGFLFVRSNRRTINFYKFWVSSRHNYPGLHEQDVFNRIKNSNQVKKIGVKLRFLDTNYFGGFCERSKDFDKVCTMHANCCVGLQNKIADLHTTLDDWRSHLSSNHTRPQPAQWRVPKQCHM